MNQGSLIVLSGFSGAGKSTVINQVLAQRPEIYFSISFTTRQPRAGEVNGVTYNFVTREEFEARIERGEFLEYAQYNGNYYGTSMAVLREKMAQGIDVILDIEVQGAALVREKMPESISGFIVPPSFQHLEDRLRGRGTDDEETIQKRLDIARVEAKEVPKYDYIILNDAVENAVAQVFAILDAARCRTQGRMDLLEDFKGE